MPRYDTRHDMRGSGLPDKDDTRGFELDDPVMVDALARSTKGMGSGKFGTKTRGGAHTNKNHTSAYGYLLSGDSVQSARKSIASGLPPSSPSDVGPDLYDQDKFDAFDAQIGEGARTEAAKAMAKTFLKSAAQFIKKFGAKAMKQISKKIPAIVKLAKKNALPIAAYAMDKVGLSPEIAALVAEAVKSAQSGGGIIFCE